MSDQHFHRTANFKTPVGRREFLRIGLGGLAGLSLPGLLNLRQTQAVASSSAKKAEKTAVILVWCRGGCSHLDTYDPKPHSGSEFAGPFRPIATAAGGMHLTELLPRQAAIADKFTLLRSVAHTGGGHPAGSLQVLAGDTAAADKLKPELPDFMSIVSYLRRDPSRQLPNYVGVNPIVNYDNYTIAGPTYLGPAYEPFKVFGDPSNPKFSIPNIGLPEAQQTARLTERVALRHGLDRLRRDLDQLGAMRATDEFESQALRLLTSAETARAFDLTAEDQKLRERYGMNAWGQQCLMARRLVEAGVDVITTTFDGPPCGRVQNWDDHAVNHHVFDALKFRAPTFDQAVSALIEDIYDRGLNRRVLVIVTGEFGRTPRISYVASSGGGVASGAAGTVQPGRDHWPNANTMLFAGGGIATGQVIGATDRRGEEVKERRVGPQDFLATIYRHLGIDYERVAINNFSGRPIPILNSGRPIPELGSRV
jgi:uncharacterized protein (DUF1501 family)